MATRGHLLERYRAWVAAGHPPDRFLDNYNRNRGTKFTEADLGAVPGTSAHLAARSRAWAAAGNPPERFLRNYNRNRKTGFTEADLSAAQASVADKGQRDAFATLADTLSRYGLESLGNWLWTQILNDVPESQIFLDLRERPEYKARFKGMELRRKNNLDAISEAEYIAWERQARAMMREANLPEGFYDSPDDFADWIGKGVSIRELNERVTNGFLAASQAPTEVRDELSRLYGIGQGGLAAFFLDPDRALPVLQRQLLASQTAASSVRAGFDVLTLTQAERLVSLGVDPGQAAGTFSRLAALREVARALPGEREETAISTERLLEAGFEDDAAAQEEIGRKAEGRAARFGGGGEPLTSPEKGLKGLGQATS